MPSSKRYDLSRANRVQGAPLTLRPGIGSHAQGFIKHRWAILSQETVNAWGMILLYLDGITAEQMASSVQVPTHAVDSGMPVSDHVVRQSASYSMEGYISTPLEGDTIPDQDMQRLNYQGTPVYVAPGPVRAGVDRQYLLLEALNVLLGIPITIYSPNYGKLGSYILISYDNVQSAMNKTTVRLSFQEIRRASFDEVIIPKVQKAKKQGKPEDLGELTPEEVETLCAQADVSNWAVAAGASPLVDTGTQSVPCNPHTPAHQGDTAPQTQNPIMSWLFGS